jgi:hypothetical protein
MKKALRSSGLSVPTRAKSRHVSEDGILHSHRHENLKTYKIIYLENFCLLRYIPMPQVNQSFGRIYNLYIHCGIANNARNLCEAAAIKFGSLGAPEP